VGALGEMTVADYVLAVEGLAMARNIIRRPDVMAARSAEMAGIVAGASEGFLATRIPVTEYGVDDGYSIWAPRYDVMDNAVIDAETPVVGELVRRLPPGVALDAACGTGRHAATLASLGWDVIGVDATDAMLALAREKVPGADLRRGRLEALPVEDASVDLVTCALALTHVEDLQPVLAELARVLRPGGRVITSDLHPWVCETGLMAGFPAEDGERDGAAPRAIHFVPNLTHHAGDYVQAIVAAGLTITGCTEPRIPTDDLSMFPTGATLPDATRQAYGGLPFLLVWECEKPATT